MRGDGLGCTAVNHSMVRGVGAGVVAVEVVDYSDRVAGGRSNVVEVGTWDRGGGTGWP
jgi:hypothetical protein